MFLLRHLQIDNVARHAVWNENNTALDACEGFTFGCYADYLYLLQKRKWFFLSGHYIISILFV